MGKKLKLDFTGVESFVKCSEGEHIAVLKEITEKQASTGSDMLVAIFEVIKGSSTGARVYDNFVLGENSMWKLKGYLECVGLKAGGKIMLDLDKMIGKQCIISVAHEEYNGSKRARIEEYKKLEASDDEEEDEDEGEDDDEDEEETPKQKKARLAKEAEAKAAALAKKKGKKKPEPEEDEDEEDEDEDDDEEEEETPKQKKARLAKEKAAKEAAAAKKKAKGKKKPADDDDEDWDEA